MTASDVIQQRNVDAFRQLPERPTVGSIQYLGSNSWTRVLPMAEQAAEAVAPLSEAAVAIAYTPIILPRPQQRASRGWECPKCGAVMAPTQPACLHCKPKARAAALNAWIDQERGTSGYGAQEGR